MEIATLIFAAIGVVAIIGVIYITVRQIYDNSTEVENLKRWHRSLDSSVDKAHDRYYALTQRVEELEGAVSDQITEEIISSRSRRRK